MSGLRQRRRADHDTRSPEADDRPRRNDSPAVDLLLTDVMMPGMNGCHLEQLLALFPSLRILFMSGYAEDVLATNVGLVPGAVFLGKPFKPKALVTKVREVLDAPPWSGSS